ncbi:Heterokaryon incompatibility [Fusarium oxysporum f. sp. vasinfectum]|nr:Heterokaryon incompatibility [Fusarium oxysporum f. sp. vasinfectum]
MDSIKVVQELDCDYLWVDRHCIDQDPKDPDKGEQIQRMDEIYSQACFTIIDAAGVDCTSGLAGVNLPRQSDPVQRYAQVNGVNLTYLGTPPAEQIRSSRWASRGWTYQEGILNVYRREKDYFHFHGNPFQGEKRCMINAWYHIEPGTRKADFPSWSWTGWKGAIKMTSYENPDHDVKLVTEAEGPITLDEYMTACKENPHKK